MILASLPDVRAQANPHGPAVSDGTVSLTNADLLRRVRAVAGQLHELGIGSGDVVSVKLRNRIEFVVVMFASWRVGATVTPVNPSLTDAEVIRQHETAGAKVLVTEDGADCPGIVHTLAVDDLSRPPGPIGIVRELLFTSLDDSEVRALGDMMETARDHMRSRPPRSAAPRRRSADMQR